MHDFMYLPFYKYIKIIFKANFHFNNYLFSINEKLQEKKKIKSSHKLFLENNVNAIHYIILKLQ